MTLLLNCTQYWPICHFTILNTSSNILQLVTTYSCFSICLFNLQIRLYMSATICTEYVPIWIHVWNPLYNHEYLLEKCTTNILRNCQLIPVWECVLKDVPQTIRHYARLSSNFFETAFPKSVKTSYFLKVSSLICRDTT